MYLYTVPPDKKFKIPHQTGTAPVSVPEARAYLDRTTIVPRPHHKPTSTAPRAYLDRATSVLWVCLDHASTTPRSHLDSTTSMLRPHRDRTSTAPRAYCDRTATVPQPHRDCTATAPEEYQRCGSLTFQRAILYVYYCVSLYINKSAYTL